MRGLGEKTFGNRSGGPDNRWGGYTTGPASFWFTKVGDTTSGPVSPSFPLPRRLNRWASRNWFRVTWLSPHRSLSQPGLPAHPTYPRPPARPQSPHGTRDCLQLQSFYTRLSRPLPCGLKSRRHPFSVTTLCRRNSTWQVILSTVY